jgi:hypothetical protein
MELTAKKYEFTGETKVVFGRTLYRIRALVAIERFGVKVGDIGGFVEKEENLSHSGDAWVYGNAEVFGDARVFDDARVYGNAEVFGDAKVYGNAMIKTSEHYLVAGPMGSRRAFTTFTRDKAGTIFVSCWCFFGDVEAFLTKVELTHGDGKHARVYRAAVQLALEQIDTTPMEDENNAEN